MDEPRLFDEFQNRADQYMSLTDVRQHLADHRADPGGTTCPACTQHVQLYRRKLHTGMARALVVMHREGGVDRFVHVPTLLGGSTGRVGADETKLRWWGLIEELAVERPDGGRAGWWRVTPKGAAFVNEEIRVPSHALVYLNRVEGFDGDLVSIRQALGDKFDLAELRGLVNP